MDEGKNELSPKAQYELQKQQRKAVRKSVARKEKMASVPKKIGKYALYGALGFGILGAVGWFLSTRPSLPPTTAQNHSEQSPPAHIVTTPIADAIQRHMLEHADGGGAPGIIIQYNCDAFACEPDLVENLTALVQRYPENVYLAPNNYDGKIIVTKLGRREILDTFDKRAIEDFIGQ